MLVWGLGLRSVSTARRVVCHARLKELLAHIEGAWHRANCLPGPREPFRRDTNILYWQQGQLNENTGFSAPPRTEGVIWSISLYRKKKKQEVDSGLDHKKWFNNTNAVKHSHRFLFTDSVRYGFESETTNFTYGFCVTQLNNLSNWQLLLVRYCTAACALTGTGPQQSFEKATWADDDDNLVQI